MGSGQRQESPVPSADRAIRLLVVDDHPLVRESLIIFLGAEPGIEIAGACNNADAAQRAALELTPDVILMDIEMPGTCAFKVARELTRALPSLRFVFISAYLTDANIDSVLELEPAGYLLKSANVADIGAAVRQAAAGNSFFGPEVKDRLFEGGISGSSRDKKPRTRMGLLTVREREVLRCVASDLSGKEIAQKLGLSARTVDRHKANIMEKLKIHSQVGLTRFALAEGILDPRSTAAL